MSTGPNLFDIRSLAKSLIRSGAGAQQTRSITIAALAILYVLDATVLGHGFVAFALLLAATLCLLPKWLLLHRIGAPTEPTARLGTMFLGCAVAIMATINFNNHLAQQPGEALVAAISHYRAVSGHYPAALDDLVPVYIDAVPRAKFTLSFNHFEYVRKANQIALTYAHTPPFGRAFYDFGQRQWVGALR